MLNWFRSQAPIRRKFDVMVGILVATAAVPIVSKFFDGGLTATYLAVHLGQIGLILVFGLWCSGIL